jgi:hypothetical protein
MSLLANFNKAVPASTTPLIKELIPPSPRTKRSNSALSAVIFFCIYKRVLIPFM